MPQRPPRKPPGDDEFPDTDRKGSSGFLDEEEFIETDDSLISDFDDLEAPAKPPPKRPAVPQPPPRVPRPPSQQMRAPREEPPPPPPPAPARPFDGAQGRRPPSQQMRTPGDDIPPPPVSVPARRPPQRAVALNRPAEEVIAPPAANIGSPAADTDMAAGGPPDGVRLIVVDGANKGEEYALERDIISLGRGADNDIVIRDVSVSRKHAKVIRDDGEFRLVDLGSGNGTLLNGRKVTDETLLSGAVFKMGNTVMRFVQIGDVYSTREDVCNSGMGFPTPAPAEPPAAPRKAPQPVTAVGAPRPVAAPGRSKALLLYGSLALVLFLAAAATVKFVILAPEGDAGSSPGGGRGRGDPAQVQKLFDEGIESFKKQEWKPAGEKFSAILGLEPQNERARQYKSKIEEELEYQESLQQAKEFVAKKILRAAIENLKKIPAESSYGAEARTMLLSVKGDFAKMRIDEGKTALAEKRHQAAYDAASEVLTVDPGNSEAVRLRAEAEDAMK
ncbi:MAG: FHA domain-containing protein [Deltaproteobacteria bacterium]|nr:FHA domain-containing protein [Deltaproteobacteria bacterium]